MLNLRKNNVLTPAQKRINELKEELKYCQQQIERTATLFELATEDELIEARIYELKSLVVHHDYLTKTIKELMMQQETEAINI